MEQHARVDLVQGLEVSALEVRSPRELALVLGHHDKRWLHNALSFDSPWLHFHDVALTCSLCDDGVHTKDMSRSEMTLCSVSFDFVCRRMMWRQCCMKIWQDRNHEPDEQDHIKKENDTAENEDEMGTCKDDEATTACVDLFTARSA